MLGDGSSRLTRRRLLPIEHPERFTLWLHLSSSLAIFEGRTVRPKAIVRPRISPTPVYEKSRKSPPPRSEIAKRLSVQAISRRFATARAFDRASLTFSMLFLDVVALNA